MRPMLTCAAALALAGCSQPAVNQAEPDEDAVEAEMENAQGAVTGQIINDAAADTAKLNAGTGPTRFACDNGKAVVASYAADGNSVSLTVDGKTLALKSVPAASGARFQSDTGLSAGKSLAWWGKGEDEAMLIQAPNGAAPGSSGETVSVCEVLD